MMLYSAFGAADSLEKIGKPFALPCAALRRTDMKRTTALKAHHDLKALDRHLGHTNAVVDAPPMLFAALYFHRSAL
jgi:hypothetical protein